jgi:hypothetical protein
LLLNPYGNNPVEKVQFKVIFAFQEHHDVIDVNNLSEYVTRYRTVGRDNPLGGETRIENPRIKCQ